MLKKIYEEYPLWYLLLIVYLIPTFFGFANIMVWWYKRGQEILNPLVAIGFIISGIVFSFLSYRDIVNRLK